MKVKIQPMKMINAKHESKPMKWACEEGIKIERERGGERERERVGCEVYVTDGSRHEKKRSEDGKRESFHLILLAKNNEGYKKRERVSQERI